MVPPELGLAHNGGGGGHGGGGGGAGHGFGGGGSGRRGFGTSLAGIRGRGFAPGFSGTRGFAGRGVFGRGDHGRFDDRGFHGRARDFRGRRFGDFDGGFFDFGFYGVGYPDYYPYPYYNNDAYLGADNPGNYQSPSSDRVASVVQFALGTRGYYRGPSDGVIGSASRRAIRSFQTDQGLPVTGSIDKKLLRALRIGRKTGLGGFGCELRCLIKHTKRG